MRFLFSLHIKMDTPDADAAQDQVQLAFARKLAHNDLKIRNKAVKKLRLWLAQRGDANTETDLLKLWKGLFYCMWMSDKPLVQEELAKRLAGISMCFKDDVAAMNYIKAFYATITREWQGIDRLRLDKFYNLISEFVGQGLLRVKRAGWQSDAAAAYSDLLTKGPLCGNDSSKPLGISLQICDNIVGALTEHGVGSADAVMAVLAPFWKILLTDYRRVLTERVETSIIGKLMTMEAEAQPGGSALPVDWEQLAETLFEGAANPETPIKKREQLYKIRKTVLKHRKQMAKAAAPKAEAAAADEVVPDAKEEKEEAAAAAAPKMVEKSKSKKKRKRADPEPLAEGGEGDEGTTSEEAPAVKKGGSKRLAASAKKGKKAASASATEDTPVSAKKVKTSKSKLKPKAVAALAAEAAEADFGHGSPLRSEKPLKSALGTPQDFTTPRRSSRLHTRRISWGDNDIRRFKKKLPPSSVSSEKKTKGSN